jgi:hypothetical protein
MPFVQEETCRFVPKELNRNMTQRVINVLINNGGRMFPIWGSKWEEGRILISG